MCVPRSSVLGLLPVCLASVCWVAGGPEKVRVQGRPCYSRAGFGEEVLPKALALSPDCISLRPCPAWLVLRGESIPASFSHSAQDRTGERKRIKRGQKERLLWSILAFYPYCSLSRNAFDELLVNCMVELSSWPDIYRQLFGGQKISMQSG